MATEWAFQAASESRHAPHPQPDLSSQTFSPDAKNSPMNQPGHDQMAHQQHMRGFTPQMNMQTNPQLDSSLANPVFAHDPFLLEHLDSNLYLGLSPAVPGDHSHDDPLLADFHLGGMEFIAPEELDHTSKAFPPLDFPQNTPALTARGAQHRLLPHHHPQHQNVHAAFESPILPSQNQKSYNQEHLYQTQKQQQRARHPGMPQQQKLLHSISKLDHTVVKQEPVFTPLVSPAVTPMDLQVNVNNQQFALPSQADFEPLTSPALKAQNQNQGHAHMLQPQPQRRRSLSTFNDDYSVGSSAKRRTPHLTPNLQAVNSKLKRSPSLRKVPQYDHLENPHEHITTSSETTPMLPPQGKRMVIDVNSQYASNQNAPAGFGPGTMMGFTMNRLAELQDDILQSSFDSSTRKQSKTQWHDTNPDNRLEDTYRRQSSEHLSKSISSLSDTSPLLEAQSAGDNDGSRPHRPTTKKTSHKIAEQGRRNRMNHAIHELSRLIPANYHENVTVPSKATTVELACEYIRHLLGKLESKKRDANMKKES